jgi:ribosomal protein S18 acetylase RimI-like enzyme
LIWSAIEEQANFFTGTDDPVEIKKGLEELFVLPNNRVSFESCMVVEIDEQVAASMISYPAYTMDSLNQLIISRLEKKYPKNSEGYQKIIQPIIVSKEAFDDEYYIDNLGVIKQYRGRGIGTKLINYAETIAKEKKFKKCSMLAEINNQRALDLYKKLGYQNDCILDVTGCKYYHMVKEL